MRDTTFGQRRSHSSATSRLPLPRTATPEPRKISLSSVVKPQVLQMANGEKDPTASRRYDRDIWAVTIAVEPSTLLGAESGEPSK
jgi:hypothetical protein